MFAVVAPMPCIAVWTLSGVRMQNGSWLTWASRNGCGDICIYIYVYLCLHLHNYLCVHLYGFLNLYI